MTLRYRECAPCRRAGHFCAAAVMASHPGSEAEEPMCRDCAEEEPCVFARVAGAGRPESGVRVRSNKYGELTFPGQMPTDVRTRTPEELGVPRAIEAEPAIALPTVDSKITDFKIKETPMPKILPAEVIDAIIGAPIAETHGEVAARLNVGESTVQRLRSKCGIKRPVGKAGRSGAAPRSKAVRKPKAEKKPKPVTAKPAPPAALAKADGAVPLNLKVNDAKADAIWKNLNLAEKAIALTAVLSARLEAM